MRRPGLLLPLLAVLACGPTAAHRAGQTLASTEAPDAASDPMFACVEGVLAASPVVDQANRPTRRNYRLRTRYVALQNPPSLRTTGVTFVVLPSRGAARELVVEYAWPGPLQGRSGMQPAADPNVSNAEGEALADVGAGLLREVRAQCAPEAPGQPACSRVAEGRLGRCVLGI